MNQARGGIGRLARWEKTQDAPNNPAVRSGSQAHTSRGDRRCRRRTRGWIGGPNRPLYRGVHPHQLRHTAASLAAKEGAKVSAVQKMLGHSSAKMALDTYTHLFDDELGGVAERFAPPPPGPQADTGPDSGRVH